MWVCDSPVSIRSGRCCFDRTDPTGNCPMCAAAWIFLAENSAAVGSAAVIATEVATGVPAPAASEFAIAGRAAQELTHSVYPGVKTGTATPSYVGITNDLARRAREWNGTYDITGLHTCKVTKDLARGIEQVIKEANGSSFSNKINSISPTRTWYSAATEAGKQWLTAHGYNYNGTTK